MKNKRTALIALAIAGGLALLSILSSRSTTTGQQTDPAVTEVRQRPIDHDAPEPRWQPGQPVTAEVMANYSFFTKRPFKISTSSASFEWTAEDGLKKDAINRLAHNPLERNKLIEQNSFVDRRQLIYCRKTLGQIASEAREAGREVKQLVLPGFDGKEFKVLVDRTEYQASDSSGTFYGRLEDRSGSMVVMTYYEDREAYTVISHPDGINFEYVPREAGEIVLNQIDPTAQRGINATCDPVLPFETGAPTATSK